ncbi:30S ribosomal protein S20 [Pseudogracilibacillus auburnensis]|uniref:Small ribosomal subunit protein bS20 n=1 Tax=Pseudogracilibacillus auburnensis TaxID=1494959 RepID=A0A2V3W0F2_9BACI|nr:30S ribosomal protein S20 [Pseudogracilibacillus auburnensis]MBO1003464.1 30S ribosomal protein S20 [Pseudogracilibacillus auburnensis]PXW86548.1 SSU ribosomal protein S20P [Pseudogracilibacillus auburnensis]
MANLKSAIKRVNTNNKKRERNQAIKSDMRTHIKQVEKLIDVNDAENATSAYNSTARIIDKAVQKGVIHKNNGNRHKARLAKKLNNLSA